MLPLYAARIEDLGLGDFLKFDCAACHHVALLTPEALLGAGLRPSAKLLDLKGRLRCVGYGRKGRAVVSIKWRGQGVRDQLWRNSNPPGRCRNQSTGGDLPPRTG
jgi:hypothetical protein